MPRSPDGAWSESFRTNSRPDAQGSTGGKLRKLLMELRAKGDVLQEALFSMPMIVCRYRLQRGELDILLEHHLGA